MVLSTLVKVDGEWMNMTDGYPKIKALGGGIMVTVRVPKFSHSVLYDPVMEYVGDEDSDDGDDAAASSLSISAALAAALCVFAPRVGDRWA